MEYLNTGIKIVLHRNMCSVLVLLLEKEKAPVCMVIKTTKPALKTLAISFDKKAPFLKRLRIRESAGLEISFILISYRK